MWPTVSCWYPSSISSTLLYTAQWSDITVVAGTIGPLLILNLWKTSLEIFRAAVLQCKVDGFKTKSERVETCDNAIAPIAADTVPLNIYICEHKNCAATVIPSSFVALPLGVSFLNFPAKYQLANQSSGAVNRQEVTITNQFCL